MPGEEEFKTPVWFKKWKIAVAIASGLIVFFTGGFMLRPYLEWGMTVDARSRMDTFEERLDKLVGTVETLTKSLATVANKEYEIDKDLVLMVIEVIEKKNKKNQMAQTP